LERKKKSIIYRTKWFTYWKWKNYIVNPSIDVIKLLYLLYFQKNRSIDKKLLGVWDFNKQTGAIGDTIVFFEVLNVFREKFNLNQDNKRNIDICYINDENHPNSKKIKYLKTYDLKKNMMSTSVVNPYIDSVFYFSSNSEFERFYTQNKDRYIQWPPSKPGIVPYDNRILIKFYKENKYLPKLNLSVEVLSKIYDFYDSHVYPSMPIILNIRKNTRMHNPNHNSDAKELKKFLDKYRNDKSFKFIIICYKAEIPDELRGLENVIFSKDHFDSIEDDIALIKTSYLSIFPASGMGSVAYFGGVPFIQYGQHEGMYFMGPFNEKKFNYLSEYQRMYFGKETAEGLISKFEDLVEYLKEKNINNNLENKVKDNKKYRSLF